MAAVAMAGMVPAHCSAPPWSGPWSGATVYGGRDRTVYVERQPAYYGPPPVYVQAPPQPVYYQPYYVPAPPPPVYRPYYGPPPVYYGPPRW